MHHASHENIYQSMIRLYYNVAKEIFFFLHEVEGEIIETNFMSNIATNLKANMVYVIAVVSVAI